MKSLVVPTLSLVGAAALLVFAPGCASDDVTTEPAEATAVETVEAVDEAVDEVVETPEIVDVETPAPAEVVEEPVAAEPEPEPAAEPAPPAGPSLTESTVGYGLAVGDKAMFEVDTTVSQDMDMGMQKMKNVVSTNTRWGLEVLSLDAEGAARVKISYGRIHGSLENPMLGSLPFDSDGTSAESGNPMLDAVGKMSTLLANKSFTATLGPHGELDDFEGLDEIVEAFGAEMGGMPMGQQVDAAQLVQAMKMALDHLPGTTLPVGGTWSSSTTASAMMGMEISVDFAHTLTGIAADALTYSSTAEAKIKVTDDGEVPDDPQMAMAREMFKEMKVTANEMKSTTRIDRRTGLLFEKASEQKMTMEMPNPMDPQSNFVIDQVTTVKAKRVDG